MSFTPLLLHWYERHGRTLPWRETHDAYRVWISEIILQQTQVAQGLDYYRRFVERFPSVDVLAAATEDEVFGLWQGLGYYSRARNLHAAAKAVVAQATFGQASTSPFCWSLTTGLPTPKHFKQSLIILGLKN